MFQISSALGANIHSESGPVANKQRLKHDENTFKSTALKNVVDVVEELFGPTDVGTDEITNGNAGGDSEGNFEENAIENLVDGSVVPLEQPHNQNTVGLSHGLGHTENFVEASVVAPSKPTSVAHNQNTVEVSHGLNLGPDHPEASVAPENPDLEEHSQNTAETNHGHPNEPENILGPISDKHPVDNHVDIGDIGPFNPEEIVGSKPENGDNENHVESVVDNHHENENIIDFPEGHPDEILPESGFDGEHSSGQSYSPRLEKNSAPKMDR